MIRQNKNRGEEMKIVKIQIWNKKAERWATVKEIKDKLFLNCLLDEPGAFYIHSNEDDTEMGSFEIRTVTTEFED